MPKTTKTTKTAAADPFVEFERVHYANVARFAAALRDAQFANMGVCDVSLVVDIPARSFTVRPTVARDRFDPAVAYILTPAAYISQLTPNVSATLRSVPLYPGGIAYAFTFVPSPIDRA